MKILFDATAIPANLGGVGRYVDDLVPELAQAGVHLTMAVQQRDVEHFKHKVPQARLITVPGFLKSRAARIAWEQVGLPELVSRIKPDVLHCPHYTFPAAIRGPKALGGIPLTVTAHDATFFSHPQAHSPLKKHFFSHAIRRCVAYADSIIVPSQATRDEILRYVGGNESDFTIAYHGVDRSVFHPVSDNDRSRVRASLGLADRPYIGFLGTLEPRKNVPALIHAWVQAFHDDPHAPVLVLAGGKGWDHDIEPALTTVPSHMTVMQPGYLPLGDLPGFLSGCEVLAYPSIGEGFGLPVLEAMACGAAVLTTPILSLPEVGGNAVAYSNPDAASLSKELLSLHHDPERRQNLAQAAQERAKTFTWQRSALAHVQAYEHALR
ncbi:glycosyltransferase family 4 protein [Actinomyces vulturis]|uniref:glycosyltransferase family 4 protein n=1 Tax=Actinomyces vulturis TaxID=1857645 RepID=UPI0008366820|nr:glycosyltransferase family 1 protein [Actinomyces vulturis]